LVSFSYGHLSPLLRPYGYAVFTSSSCRLFDSPSSSLPFLVGSKLPSADLWSSTVPSQSISLSSSTALFSLQALPHARFVAYWHRAFGSPSLTTFMKALSRGFIHGIPDLTTSLLRKLPPLSLSTAFGHLDTLRQGIASTTRPPPRASLYRTVFSLLFSPPPERFLARNGRPPTSQVVFPSPLP
jgi:hypothetical protein